VDISLGRAMGSRLVRRRLPLLRRYCHLGAIEWLTGASLKDSRSRVPGGDTPICGEAG